MTIDQNNSSLHTSHANNFGAANFIEDSENAAQNGRRQDIPGRLRSMPALSMRVRVSDARKLQPSSTSLAGRSNTERDHCESRTGQLLTCAHEDVSRLNEILRTQQCTAVIRDADGVLLPLHSPEIQIHGGLDSVAAERLTSSPRTTLLSTPIFDSDGRPLASLGVLQASGADSNSSNSLLLALAESAARAITERWFRLVHRRQWVVAATQRNVPSTFIVFATDRDQRIVGANQLARQLLEKKGQRMGPHLTASAIFRPNPALLRRRGHGDVSTTLFASGDGEPWLAIITPPDPGAMNSRRDARVLLHVRPRQDSLAHLLFSPSSGREKRGLPQAALQRIEDYIAAHLDSALDIDELAAVVRMSSSHFTRSFHKSVGVTPHRYVVQNRVMRARELLVTTMLPLSEIALTTGFSDQSHFSRRFHEIVGVPPGAFRGSEGRLTS